MAGNSFWDDYTVLSVLRNIEYDLKQDIIIDGSPPSLQYLTLLKIAITIWQKKLRNAASTLFINENLEDEISIFKNELIKGIFDLIIPNLLKVALEPIICSVGDELEKFLIYEASKFLTLDEFKICLDNIIWTQQGTVNLLKTVTQVIDNTNLSSLLKFELACNYCLIDKILYFKELCDEDYIKPDVFDETNTKFHLVVFWILHVNETLYKFSNITGGAPTTEYLLEWAIYHKKEAAVQFICENFADEALREQYMDFMDYAIDYIWLKDNKIAFYLFQQLNKSQIIAYFQRNAVLHQILLNNARKISRWSDAVDTPKYALEIIKRKESFYRAIEYVGICIDEGFLNMTQFRAAWDIIILRFKSEIDQDFMHACNYYFWKLDLQYNNMFVYLFQNNYYGRSDNYERICPLPAKYLLRMGTAEQMRRVIYGYNFMKFILLRAIKSNPSDYIDKFFNQMLEEEEISEFKVKFFERNYSLLLLIFLKNSKDKYKWIDDILNRYANGAFLSRLEKQYFLECYAIKLSFILMKNKHNADNTLTVMKKFLNWCFDGNKKEIGKYTVAIFYMETNLYKNIKEEFFNIVKDLIQQRKWKLTKRYWSFIFYATDEVISTQEEKFRRCRKLVFFMFKEECVRSYMRFILYYSLNMKRFIMDSFKH